MPRRIIIHAGFHKTGTSTIQNFLRSNRVALRKQVALRLRWHMKDLLSATRGYSTDLDPLTLIKVQTRFGALMNDLPGMPRRTLILSAEELAGHLPGRGALADYSAAPTLLYAFWEIAKARYPQAEILIYLTTRAPEPWLASAYWEHVKSSSMTMDFDTFTETYHKAADLDRMAAEIASRVPAPVHAHALETCRALPLGPADPLMALCEVPDEILKTLVPEPVANARPNFTVLETLLEVNRNTKGEARRKQLKSAILAQAENR